MAVPLIFVPELHWHIAFRPNLGYLFSPDLVIIPDVVVIPDLDWCAGIVLLAHSDASDMQHDAVNKPKKCTHSNAEQHDDRLSSLHWVWKRDIAARTGHIFCCCY